MSEIRSISEGTFVIGDTNGLTFEAGPGISVSQPSEGSVRIANDETVLFESTNGSLEANGFTVSEQLTNFERIRYIGSTNTCLFAVEIPTYSDIASNFRFGVTCMCPDADGSPIQLYGKSFTSNNGLTYTASRSLARWFAYGQSNLFDGTQPFWGSVYKIVGINRISGGNNE